MSKIVILYTDAGGGHKSAALSLQEIIQTSTDWEVQLVNPYQELCSEFDIIKRWFGISSETLYNRYVSENHNALLKFLIIAGFFKLNVALSRSKITRKLTAAWHDLQPTMLISVSPFINEVVAQSVRQLPKQIPFVTFITDYQECCKNVWITKQPQKLICCSDKLVQRALKRNVARDNIFQLSGMLVAKRFYQVRQLDKSRIASSLGLQPNLSTILVTFGSHGSEDMLTIAKNLRSCPYPMQAVFICGYDTKLQQDLAKLHVDYPLIVTGFVNNVEQYMLCADVFIGKPGGLSITEAALLQLPLILKYNLFTLIHERHNARWVLEKNIGITVKNFKNIQVAVRQVLENKQQFAAAFMRLNNHAYMEILPILEQVLDPKSHKLQQTSLPANALALDSSSP